MYEVHVHQPPEGSIAADEALIMAYAKNTLEILRSRGLTPAQAVLKLFCDSPHLRLESPTWVSAQCIVFLELQRIFELRGEDGCPFYEPPRGH